MTTRERVQILPDFLIIGAAKCGSTTLYNLLSQHPDVLMSSPKEPFFFENEYEKGLRYYSNRYFPGYSGQALVGEARVGNLYLPFVPQRIWESLPDAKLVAILRHPVDRAFSHWWMRYSVGYDPLGFEEALEENFKRLESGQDLEGHAGQALWRSRVIEGRKGVDLRVYVDAGYYARQLARYFRFFPKQQVKILYFEEFKRDPKSVFLELAAFLNLDCSEFPEKIPHNKRAHTKLALPLMALDRRFGLSRVIPKGVLSVVKSTLSSFGERPQMNPQTRRMLLEHYAPFNRELEKLLGRSFPAWER